MRILVTRVDTRRCQSRAIREDGVSVLIDGYASARRLPHDLAHFAVEDALQSRYGFWGCVAAGQMLRGMTAVDAPVGTRSVDAARPDAAASAAAIAESDALVAACGDLIEDGLETRWPAVPPPLDRLTVRRGARQVPLTKSDIARVAVAWRALRTQWDALPVGGTLELAWQHLAPSGNWPAVR
jgi:hypothetical protein